MRRTHEGALAGVGAVYGWEGNNQVGAGRMTIIESRSAELIRLTLEFYKPMAAVSTAEFSFRPQGQGAQTVVTWSMVGTNNFISRAFCLFMNMDKLVGGQFEQGLDDLKTVVERPVGS